MTSYFSKAKIIVRFEWDENKRLVNLQKHGIDFADVWQIFDYDVVTDFDNRFDYGEIRYLSLGLLQSEVIVVAHTEDDEVFQNYFRQKS